MEVGLPENQPEYQGVFEGMHNVACRGRGRTLKPIPSIASYQASSMVS